MLQYCLMYMYNSSCGKRMWFIRDLQIDRVRSHEVVKDSDLNECDNLQLNKQTLFHVA